MENRLVVNTGKGGRRMGEISEGIKKKRSFVGLFPGSGEVASEPLEFPE